MRKYLAVPCCPIQAEEFCITCIDSNKCWSVLIAQTNIAFRIVNVLLTPSNDDTHVMISMTGLLMFEARESRLNACCDDVGPNLHKICVQFV